MSDVSYDAEYEQTFKSMLETLSLVDVMRSHATLGLSFLQTPLGLMYVVSDDDYLYRLSFADLGGLKSILSKLSHCMRARIELMSTGISDALIIELNAYFKGELTQFNTPYYLTGTSFQKTVWRSLATVSYGKTLSYQQLAHMIKRPKAYRAVANANGANPLVIMIPCHRVIRHSGVMGGYTGGVERKNWLLQHECDSIVETSGRMV